MRHIQLAIIAVLSLTFALSAAHADKSDDLRKFGLGVSLLSPTTWEVPITLSPKFRLAPMVSVVSNTTTTTPKGGDAAEASTSTMGFGFGAFYTMYKKKYNFLYYTGLRFMANLNSQGQPAGDKTVTIDSTDLMFAPTVGGEYFFTSRFSLGAEFALSVMMDGDEVASEGDDETVVEGMTMSTVGSLMARIYF